MLTHILQDRTGPLGEQGGRAALVRVTWRGCSSLSKSRQVPQRVIFFFFSLCKSSKGNAVTARCAAGAKHGSDAMLSNIKQRVVRSRHSAVQLEVILKRPPQTSRDWKVHSHTSSRTTLASTSPSVFSVESKLHNKSSEMPPCYLPETIIESFRSI